VHDKPSLSQFDAGRPEALRMSERTKQMKPKVLAKLADSFKMSQCLVFCRTNIDCNNLESYFNRLGGAKSGFRGKMESGKENPYSCVVLAGARNQKERQRNLEAFKDGDVRFLICTDVAARGLDIAGLPFVIQMTLPDDIENYVHRIGRCGRAERLGLAISIVGGKKEKVWYHKCPTKGKNCQPSPGNTKLTVPFGSDGKPVPEDESRWYVDEGGCTIWYDESTLLRQVEERIGANVAVMDQDDFSVPGFLESPLDEKLRKKPIQVEDQDMEAPSRRAQKRKQDDAQQSSKMVAYGSKKHDAAASQNLSHASAIKSTVVELAALETQIQQMFAKAIFSNGGADGRTTVPAPALADHSVHTTAGVFKVPLTTPAVAIGTGGQDLQPLPVGNQQASSEKPRKKIRW